MAPELLRQPLPSIPSISLPTDTGPTYSVAEGRVRVDYQLGHVNQSDSLDVVPFEIWAPLKGRHEVEWEITATGLTKAAKGTFEVHSGP